MNVLLLDNYDPSTADLYRYLSELGTRVSVHRNDEIEVDEIAKLAPDRIVISSGPGIPAEAGISLPLIRELGVELPILGIGLGYAAIGAAFGGRAIPTPEGKNGVLLLVEHVDAGVFRDLPSPLAVTGHHGLILDRETLPDTLTITAWSSDGLIMGLCHRMLPIEGIRFLPESHRAEHGKHLLRNFLGSRSLRV